MQQALDTVIESGTGIDRDALYRRRHASLGCAGSYHGLIAEGGMGAVILATDHPASPGGEVAIKVVREERLHDQDSIARFRRELANHRRLSQRLQVPRIAPCLGAAIEDPPTGVHGLFQYFPDGSLAAALGAGMSLADALRVLADAAEGLQALHGLRLIHRDVCPGNIFVEREGGRLRGVLGDLGVAVSLGADTIFTEEQVAEDLRHRTGHAGYMDPWHGGTVDADMYSLGATLYWLVAGAGPPTLSGDGGLSLPAAGSCRRGVTAALHRRASDTVQALTCRELDRRIRSAPRARAAIASLAELADGPGRTSRWKVAAWAGLVSSLAAGALVVGWPWPGADAGALSRDAAQVTMTESVAAEVTAGSPGWEVSRDDVAGVPPGAAALADAAIVADPVPATVPPPPASRTPAPRRLLGAAASRLEAGDPGTAEVLLRDLDERFPGDPDVAALLAPLLVRQGADGEAEAVARLRAALEASPKRGDLRLALARVLAQRGELEEAAAVLSARPKSSSHRREIEALAVTLERHRHRVG